MKILLSAIALTLLVLIAFTAGLAVGLGQPPDALYATIVENATGETPEAKIGAYVRAIARQNDKAAMAIWDISDWHPETARATQMAARRESVTRELIAAGIRSDYMILNTEWWGTCCEPRVINDSRGAGGARVQVQFLDKTGAPLGYRFDVFTRGGAYWGDAMGYPPRQWILRDVYRLEDKPLFWTLVHESSIHSVDTNR